ncbi:MAG: hypothetical protein ACFFCT_13755, partial [Candidatus Odinarchaeota archaeon]
ITNSESASTANPMVGTHLDCLLSCRRSFLALQVFIIPVSRHTLDHEWPFRPQMSSSAALSAPAITR